MASQQVEKIYVELQANIAKYKAAMHDASNVTKNFGKTAHNTVSSTQAASAAIRILEGNTTNLVRAAERFVGQSRVLSGALKAAFPVIGAVAIASVIGEGISRMVKFIETANKIPQALRDAFESSNLSITTTNDNLQKSNDELANQILKLEGKPQNNLALAIDDARIKADQLAKSLMEDNKQVQELLKANSISWYSGAFTHQNSTSGTAGLVKYWADELQQRGNAVVVAQHQFGVGSSQDKAAQAALAQRQLDAEASVQQRLTQLQAAQRSHVSGWRSMGSGATADQSANIDIAQGYLAQLYGRDNEAALQQTNTQERAKLAALQHAKELTQAQKAAQEKLMRQDESALAQQRNQKEQWSQAWTPQDDVAFWQAHISAFTKGSDAYNAVQDKIYTAEQEISKKFHALIKQTNDDAARSAREDIRYYADQAKQIENAANIIARATEQAGVAGARIRAEGALAAAQSQAENGQINPAQLAAAQSAAHIAEYREQLAQMRSEMADLQQSDYGQLSPENKLKQMQLQTQIDATEEKAHLQAMEDAQNQFATTWKGTINSIYDTVIAKSQMTMQQIQQITEQTVDGINSVLASTLTERHRMGWTRDLRNGLGGVFRGTAQGLSKTALEKLEGSVIGGLGLGKRDGSTAAQALYVQMVGGFGSGGGIPGLPNLGLGSLPQVLGPNGITSSITGGSGGLLGMLNDSNFFSSLFDGRLFGSGSFFGGHFANGGDVYGGLPIDVGEYGPERFVPYTNGRIIPNSELTRNAGHSVYVDARGSHDPAMIEATVHRAMQKYIPGAAKLSTSVLKERSARRPTTAR